MYRIVICDDNQADIDYISGLLSKWTKDTGNFINVENYLSAESFLFQYEEDKSYDILLLDIEMGAMNGMELAKKIRKDNSSVQIIFITGYMEYISDGYDVEALHYLIKPVTEEKMYSVLKRAVDRLKSREKELYLSSAGSMVRIPLCRIRYLEVQKNYVTIHEEENYTVKKTLNELEKELDESFFRTGRSYIVNLRFIKIIAKSYVVLEDGTNIPLSRNLYENINRAIIQYF